MKEKIHESGTVLKVGPRRLEISIDQQRPEMCAKCRACEILGQGKRLVLRLPAAGSFAAGQRVTVEVPQVSPWIGIVFVLGLPIVMLVIGMLVGSTWRPWREALRLDAELSGAVMAVAAGALTFFAARLIERRYACDIKVNPLSDSPE